MPFGDDCEILIEYVPRSDLQVIYRKATKTIYKNHQKLKSTIRQKAINYLQACCKGLAGEAGRKGFVNDGQPFRAPRKRGNLNDEVE